MIGQTISHYKVLERLGEGGMGVVYKAEDTNLDRTVALKFLPSDLTRDAEAKIRFTQEAKAASALDHPNVCTIYEIGETSEDRLFIAMACYEGETLKQRIARGEIPLGEALDIAQQIGLGLAKAHEKEIVHRDIKPANIFVTDDGLVKILDFGLAKLAGQRRLTRTGTTVGTVAYMSPEQARGEAVDHRTDVWSLGVVLYEMVTGELPFRGEHEQATIYSIINDEPKPLGGHHTDVPKTLTHIVKMALAKNPNDRYASVEAMLADLASCRKAVDADQAAHANVDGWKMRRKKAFLYGGFSAVAVALVIVVGVLLAPKRDEGIDSIAVLPLENLSGDPDQEFFADGMTDELISNIAKVSALRVISRTSVMRYKDTEKTLPQIAAELDVDAIVEGSVLRSGNRVRISAQLIDAAEDEHLWAESYERDLRDVLSLQRELARVIAERVNIELTPEEHTTLTSGRSVNPAAHEAYLKGRFHWNKRTKEGLEKSLGFFEEAIAYDPEYALAYAGLAGAYIVLADWDYRPPRECHPVAKDLVTKALAIDDGLAEAYAALAYIMSFYEWRWTEAEPYFERAIKLNPNYATAHQWYAEYLFSVGRLDGAIEEAKRAQELDPLSVIAHTMAGMAFYYANQYDRAVAQYDKALEIDDDFQWVLLYKAESLRELGRYDEALEFYLRSLQVLGLDREGVADVRRAYEGKGIAGYYRWFVDDGFERVGRYDKLRHHAAVACTFLGEKDRAFEWLERCFEDRSRNVPMVKSDPGLAGLRSDPRYADLLQRVGLQQ